MPFLAAFWLYNPAWPPVLQLAHTFGMVRPESPLERTVGTPVSLVWTAFKRFLGAKGDHEK
jgi:hypothetical protein